MCAFVLLHLKESCAGEKQRRLADDNGDDVFGTRTHILYLSEIFLVHFGLKSFSIFQIHMLFIDFVRTEKNICNTHFLAFNAQVRSYNTAESECLWNCNWIFKFKKNKFTQIFLVPFYAILFPNQWLVRHK